MVAAAADDENDDDDDVAVVAANGKLFEYLSDKDEREEGENEMKAIRQ